MTPDNAENYAEMKKRIGHIPLAFKDLAESNPKMHDTILTLDSFIWDNGALTRKEKKLIAVAIAAALRDTGATHAQLMGAKNLGVTLDEVDEALRVAFMLSGMPAYVQGITEAKEIFAQK